MNERVMDESMDYDDSPVQDMGEIAYPSDEISPVSEYAGEIRADNSLRDIRIKPLSSGFMVTVGCQSIAIETNKSLIKALTLYLEEPSEFERKWFSKDVRNKLENI